MIQTNQRHQHPNAELSRGDHDMRTESAAISKNLIYTPIHGSVHELNPILRPQAGFAMGKAGRGLPLASYDSLNNTKLKMQFDCEGKDILGNRILYFTEPDDVHHQPMGEKPLGSLPVLNIVGVTPEVLKETPRFEDEGPELKVTDAQRANITKQFTNYIGTRHAILNKVKETERVEKEETVPIPIYNNITTANRLNFLQTIQPNKHDRVRVDRQNLVQTTPKSKLMSEDLLHTYNKSNHDLNINDELPNPFKPNSQARILSTKGVKESTEAFLELEQVNIVEPHQRKHHVSFNGVGVNSETQLDEEMATSRDVLQNRKMIQTDLHPWKIGQTLTEEEQLPTQHWQNRKYVTVVQNLFSTADAVKEGSEMETQLPSMEYAPKQYNVIMPNLLNRGGNMAQEVEQPYQHHGQLMKTVAYGSNMNGVRPDWSLESGPETNQTYELYQPQMTMVANGSVLPSAQEVLYSGPEQNQNYFYDPITAQMIYNPQTVAMNSKDLFMYDDEMFHRTMDQQDRSYAIQQPNPIRLSEAAQEYEYQTITPSVQERHFMLGSQVPIQNTTEQIEYVDSYTPLPTSTLSNKKYQYSVSDYINNSSI